MATRWNTLHIYIAPLLVAILAASTVVGLYATWNMWLDPTHYTPAKSWTINEIFWETHICVDPYGNIWVADSKQVKEFTPDGMLITNFSGRGVEPQHQTWITDLATDRLGNLFIVDRGVGTIKCFAPNGTLLHYWEITGPPTPYPYSIWVGRDDLVYVAEPALKSVLRFTLQGELVDRWGQHGTEPGEFITPNLIAIDSLGDVYIADLYAGRLQKFTANGTFLTVLYEWTPPDYEGPPRGDLCIDSAGYLYLTDTENDLVYKLTPTGNPIAILGGSGNDAGHLSLPTGVAVDASSALYIAEVGNMRIQKFVPTIGGPFVQLIGAILVTVTCATIVVAVKVYIRRRRQTMTPVGS